MIKKIPFKAVIVLVSFLAIVSCGGGGGGAASDDDSKLTIGYNANGAESGSAPAAQSGNSKTALTVSSNTGNLAKNGYLFDGWNTQPDGYGTDYAPGAEYKGKAVTLYAKWAKIFNYDVINSGSPAPALNRLQRAPGNPTATITGLTSKGMTLSDISIPRTIDGYTVSAIGNNAFQDCTNVANMLIPDTITNIGDNAFNGCSNLAGVTMQGTVPPTLGTNAFAGCVLLAVSVPQSAASAYNSSPTWSTVSILAPGTFSIIYNGNGSDGGIVPARQVGMIGINLNIYGNNGSLTRAGCTFNGWNDKANGTGHSYVENATYPGPDNMTLYAQWTHPDYTVTFDDQGADIQHVSPSTIKVVAPANTIDSLPSTQPQKDGYYFTGWNTQSDGAGDTFVVGSQVISNTTVYAKWVGNNCTISYDGNNATRGSAPESHATQFNQSITLKTNTGNLERDGYRFSGWNTQADGGGTDYAVGASYNVTGDVLLYAKWLPLYTITYDSNGATSGSVPSSQQGVYGEQINIQSNTRNLARAEFEFVGWNTEADGSGSDYVVGTSYTITGDVTLYVKWNSIYSSTLGSRAGVAVGDIVLSNGKTITTSNFTTYASQISSAGLTPVGVVAYKLNLNWRMIGLKQNSLVWAKNGTTGCNTSFSTSQTDGLGNWNVIKTTDPTGSADAATNYPAFNFAKTYGSTYCQSGVYSDRNWYIPSAGFNGGHDASGELYTLYYNRTTINNAMTTLSNAGIDVELLADGIVWSSSQGVAGSDVAFICNFRDGAGANFHKYSTAVVRVVCCL